MFAQELPELKPERMIGAVRILCRTQENHHKRLALINHGAIGIFRQQRPKILSFLFESGLSISILDQDVLVNATQERNQLEPRSQP